MATHQALLHQGNYSGLCMPDGATAGVDSEVTILQKRPSCTLPPQRDVFQGGRYIPPAAPSKWMDSRWLRNQSSILQASGFFNRIFTMFVRVPSWDTATGRQDGASIRGVPPSYPSTGAPAGVRLEEGGVCPRCALPSLCCLLPSNMARHSLQGTSLSLTSKTLEI